MQALLVGQPGKIRYRALDTTELPFQDEFDLVLCDAPCSGTGTLARNPEIRHRLAMDDFARQHERQVRLLCSAMRALREGGRLVYSTCSLERGKTKLWWPRLGSGRRASVCFPGVRKCRCWKAQGVLRPGTADRLFPGALPDDFVRLLPGAYQGDGFFAACLVRE